MRNTSVCTSSVTVFYLNDPITYGIYNTNWTMESTYQVEGDVMAWVPTYTPFVGPNI